jgi:poly(hydroxyalkanoate) depolymerase family esterase
MTTNFERMMAEAARLMRAGSLGEATAAIQSALGAGPAPASSPPIPPHWGSDDVIDVEARVVDEESSADPGTKPGAEAGAARTAATESFVAGSFRNELGTRDFKLYEPARDGRPLPLVVMLHGCTQDPDDFARGTGMNELARRQGFLVLYPAQSQRSNPSRCWNWFKHNHQAAGRGEPGILAGMVLDVIARHHADADRVYVAGLSAGGAMAAILGDAYPELFAAVGVHSGLPTGAATDAQSAFAAMSGGGAAARRARKTRATPPTIVFHGDADTTVQPINGDRVIEASGLAANAGVRLEQGHAGRDFTRRTYLDASGAAQAEQWTIHGAGHAWSGGHAPGSYTDPNGPDASAEMVRFFLAHPRR